MSLVCIFTQSVLIELKERAALWTISNYNEQKYWWKQAIRSERNVYTIQNLKHKWCEISTKSVHNWFDRACCALCVPYPLHSKYLKILYLKLSHLFRWNLHWIPWKSEKKAPEKYERTNFILFQFCHWLSLKTSCRWKFWVNSPWHFTRLFVYNSYWQWCDIFKSHEIYHKLFLKCKLCNRKSSDNVGAAILILN